jgi:RND family efflux transporter MFP subunit
MENKMRIMLPLLVSLLALPAQAIDLNGIAEFDQRHTLNSSISARVEQVHVEIGQSVATGDLLLTLVSTGLQAQVNIASAEVDQLAPQLERMLTELDKAQELYDRDSLARVALQQAQQDYTIAAAKLAAAEANLDLARFHLSQAQLRSPIDGIVLSINTFPGQYINTRVSDETLLTVADNKAMSVQALMPIELFHKSLLNKPAQVTYLKQTFRGKVVAIDRQASMGANNHPSMFLQIKFATDGSLPAGLPVKISVDAN